MRFILNFIFFGVLFYLIWLFFPEAFDKLVSWANQAYEFLRDLFTQASDKVQSYRHSNDAPPQRAPEGPPRSLLIPLLLLTASFKSGSK
jgi:hypothetical protein